MALKAVLAAAAALLLCIGAADAQPAPEIHPALFVARDSDSTLYLYGTVHVRRRGEPWGGPEAHAALMSADEVWTEIEISPEAEAQAMMMMERYGRAPPDRPLTSLLTDAEAEQLRALAASLGMPMAQLETLQPWLASILLSMAPAIQQGYDPASGVDRAIDAIADAAGKPSRGLETAEQQFRFISGLDAQVQREMLLDAINDAEESPAELQRLTLGWEQGDLSALEAEMVGEMKGRFPELYDALMTRRNAAWTDVLMRELEGSGVDFVAVGAAHLVGPESLIAMLEARGVRVERVSPAE